MNGIDLGALATVLGVFGLSRTPPAAVAGKVVDAQMARTALRTFGLTRGNEKSRSSL